MKQEGATIMSEEASERSYSVATRLAAFAVLLAATFAAAWSAGAAWSPDAPASKQRGSRKAAPTGTHGGHESKAPASTERQSMQFRHDDAVHTAVVDREVSR